MSSSLNANQAAWSVEISNADFLGRISAVMDGVCNPERPTCCPWCTNSLAYELSRDDNRVTLVQRKMPEFFTVCMGLLTHYASTHIPQLRQRLLANQHACPDRPAMHRRPLPCGMTDPVKMLIWALYTFVHHAMTGGTRPIDCTAYWHKPPFYRRHGHWPRNLTDIFPCGVEKGVEALVFWCCAPSMAHPFGLLAAVTFIARAVVLPHLLRSPTRERLLWAVLQILTPVVRPIPWSGPAPFRLPPGLTVPRNLRGAKYAVDQVLELLNTLHEGYDGQTHELLEFVSGYEELLLRALEWQVPCYAEDPEPRELRRSPRMMLDDHVALLHLLLDLPSAEPAQPTPMEVIRDATVRWFCARYCANAACRVNELSETGLQRFGVCSFCRLTRYCSRDCQRVDWTVAAPGVTHKMVCPLLSKLFSRLGKVPDVDTLLHSFEHAFDKCDFDVRDVRILHRWALASGILPASIETLQFSRPLALI
ncbi:hypothetical protein AURDEDRAFT_130893 [Auricularia subglabra TFB-10046 SS5]|nr:hypothetical protein AURDEDRAFT_130893 [Auricularia subglabra TFB-10046 SS5]